MVYSSWLRCDVLVLCAVRSVGTSTNETVSFTWGVGAPPSLGSTTDLWVGRYTFYLRAPASANYTLRADVDDLVQLWLDDVPVFSGNRGGTVTIYLSAGYHPARMHYLEWWGWSSLTLSWDGGVPGAVSHFWQQFGIAWNPVPVVCPFLLTTTWWAVMMCENRESSRCHTSGLSAICVSSPGLEADAWWCCCRAWSPSPPMQCPWRRPRCRCL